jgi:myo-inositol 2-dehydrogenase/D-chiro-inositol 1-dehydrogenase
MLLFPIVVITMFPHDARRRRLVRCPYRRARLTVGAGATLWRMQNVRVGVIGVGGMGSFHAHTLASLAHVDVIAVADPYQPNVDKVTAALGCQGLDDPMALATEASLDGVVIASPDSTHADLAIAAMDTGLWVLCEKPLATSIVDGWRVVDAESALGSRRIQVGFMREYDPAHVQLMADLPEAGRIDALRAVHRNSNDRRRPLAQIVGQSMVHDIHSARFISGEEITSVHAFGAGASDDSYRHVLAVCRLESGAHAVLEFDDAGFAYEVSVEVLGADGDVLTGAPTRAVRRRKGSLDTYIGPDWFAWFAEAYRAQDEAWVASIAAGAAVGPSAWDGLVAQHVVEAIIRSLATGESVAVEPLAAPAVYLRSG